jgi:hypothetical protein
MEIFVHNLPTHKRPQRIQWAIAKTIRAVHGPNAVYEWSPFTRKRALGSLTFPTSNMGSIFLQHCRSGVNIFGNRVKFDVSRNPPNERLVESLLAKMAAMQELPSETEEEDVGRTTFEDASIPLFLTENYGIEYVRKGITFESIEWGVWTTEGHFGHVGKMSRGGLITHNTEKAVLDVVGIVDVCGSTFLSQTQEENGIVIDNSIIEELLVDRRAEYPRLFVTLNRIPRFWSQNKKRHDCGEINDDHDQFSLSQDIKDLLESLASLFDEEPPTYRVPALSSEHAAVAPYCTVYVFNLIGHEIEKRLQRLFNSTRRWNTKETSTQITTSPIDFQSSFKQLNTQYSQYEYRIAFQMELFIRNCLLIPSEVIDLHPQIQTLLKKHKTDTTVRFLQAFALRLPIRRYDELSHGINFSKILADAVENFQFSWQPRNDPNIAWIHRLDVMPSAYNMEGPNWMGSNRFLRLYPNHHDNFLKVSFVEEDLSMIRNTREFDLKLDSILEYRWKPILRSQTDGGINLAGKHFTFLGFSSSSLKEHSTWFMAPFEHEGASITADSLRSQLGDFRKIRCPPRYAARLGQTFTTTTHSLVLSANEVSYIPDVIGGDGGDHVFSDGVGKASRSMLERIWKETRSGDKQIKPVV